MTDLARAAFARSIVRGLDDNPRWLSCRYLYDAAGSDLFERITEQPEYYLTRVEAALLASHARDIAALAGPSTIVELGAGSAKKTRLLLEAWAMHGRTRYVPVDICADMLMTAADRLASDLTHVTVEPLCATY